MRSTIEASDLGKTFATKAGPVNAVQGELQVAAGEVVGLLGRTGQARPRPCGCCPRWNSRAQAMLQSLVMIFGVIREGFARQSAWWPRVAGPGRSRPHGTSCSSKRDSTASRHRKPRSGP